MSERYKPSTVSFEEKLNTLKVGINQMTTRGDGLLELGEEFKLVDLDFGSALDHINIHQNGEVAGSQFNGGIIKDVNDIKTLILKFLPSILNYDQFGRCELTLDVDGCDPLGYSGVKSFLEIQEDFPDAIIEKRMRIPGGFEDVVDGVEGAWYPEMDRTEKGWEVTLLPNGQIKNPKAKFEPKANIVKVTNERFQQMSETNKFTIIIQKDNETLRPTVLTVFPGENAPAYPVRIDTDTYQSDSLKNSKQRDFWDTHAFVEGTLREKSISEKEVEIGQKIEKYESKLEDDLGDSLWETIPGLRKEFIVYSSGKDYWRESASRTLIRIIDSFDKNSTIRAYFINQARIFAHDLTGIVLEEDGDENQIYHSDDVSWYDKHFDFFKTADDETFFEMFKKMPSPPDANFEYKSAGGPYREVF